MVLLVFSSPLAFGFEPKPQSMVTVLVVCATKLIDNIKNKIKSNFLVIILIFLKVIINFYIAKQYMLNVSYLRLNKFTTKSTKN